MRSRDVPRLVQSRSRSLSIPLRLVDEGQLSEAIHLDPTVSGELAIFQPRSRIFGRLVQFIPFVE